MKANQCLVRMIVTRASKLQPNLHSRVFWCGVLVCCGCVATSVAGPIKIAPQPARTVAAPSFPPVQQLAPNRSSTQILPAAKVPSVEVVDTWTEKLGGSVYSTGAEDIIVRIRGEESNGLQSQGDRVVRISPFTKAIYLMSPQVVLIGSNREAGKEVNLGRLAPGELLFAVTTVDGYTLYTGNASRNVDQLDHAIVRAYRSGVTEVWFEDAPGPFRAKGTRSDRNFADAVIQLRGGVSDNGAVAQLLKVIKEQAGEPRLAAIEALKKINPKAAAMAGFQ